MFLALVSQVDGVRVAYIAFFPVLFLWFLDAKNEFQKVQLLRLYERVRTTPPDRIDFDIRTSELKIPSDSV